MPDASTQAEKRQHGNNDDDQADNVDDAIHGITSRFDMECRSNRALDAIHHPPASTVSLPEWMHRTPAHL